MSDALKSFIPITILMWFVVSINGYALNSTDDSFINPILAAGPDPYVYLHTDGYYYTMVTVGDRLKIWKSRSFTDLADAESKVVWNKPDTGPNSCCIWAPEIHYIDNVWYIYYTATDGSNPIDESRYVFVLRNKGTDPLNEEWEDMGKINTAYPGIDGQVFEYKGQWYFVYSPYVAHQSGISIAKMTSPWTIEQPESLLGLPIYDWEKTDHREIMEGPQFLKGPGNKIFIIYSAGACWDDNYGLGWLAASKDADLMDPGSWTRTAEQVFSQSLENKAFGPGHNCFTVSPDSTEHWIVYHAKEESSDQCAKRELRAQKFEWDANGYPVFGKPVPINTPIKKPSGWNKNSY